MSDATSFSWRRELPWILLPVAICLAIRFYAAQYAIVVFNGDAAVHLLMAKHWAQGHFPLYFYGQSYVGSLEALFAAPFYSSFGSDPMLERRVVGMGYAQAILAAVLVVLVYRLCHMLGGRLAALAGSLPFAIGTLLFLLNTACQYGSYPSTQMLGMLLWLAALPLLTRVTGKRLFACGLIAGFGFWNNPQISSFIAPLMVLLYLRGRTLALLHESRLRTTLGRLARPAKWAFGLIVLLFVVCFTVALLQPHLDDVLVMKDGRTIRGKFAHVDKLGAVIVDHEGVTHSHARDEYEHAFKAGSGLLFGKVKYSFTRPYKYFVRSFMALFAFLFGLELIVVTERKRWLLLFAAFGAGFVIGNLPERIYHLRKDKARKVKSAPVGLNPTKATEHVKTFGDHFMSALFNRHLVGTKYQHHQLDIGPETAGGRRPWADVAAGAHTHLRTALIGAALLCLIGCIVVRRRDWLAMTRLRPPDAGLTPVLMLHALGLIALYLMFPFGKNEARYLQALWIPLAGLFAGSAAWLRRRHAVLAGLLIGITLASYGIATPHNLKYMKAGYYTRINVELRVMQDLRELGITRGRAHFWIGFPINCLSDEEVVLTQFDSFFIDQHPPYHELVERVEREGGSTVFIFEPLQREEDAEAERVMLRDHGHLVVRRWVILNPKTARRGGKGPYHLYHVRWPGRP